MKKTRAVKGTKDILPGGSAVWQRLESLARTHFGRYGYREMRTPLFEETELFARGIGAETDIVSKEMYTFDDRDGSSLTLRPEATAGIVRAVIEHSLMQTDPALRVYTLGPMFRREQPQKGRQRQFHQINVEAFGVTRPTIDSEIIEMGLSYLEACGLSGHTLILNSVGDARCRPAYVAALERALEERASHLCPDCQRRSGINPLRVLDCKVPADQALIDELPRFADHLCADCRDHFAEVRRQLELLGIPYGVSHRLVRGLDYYTRTTFEITSESLGAQNTVLGGGRYDGLVQELGGPDLCGIGFALGVERLVLSLPEPAAEPRCDVFVALLAEEGLDTALTLQNRLRRTGLVVLMDHEGRSFKAKMKLADRLGARYVAMLGADELAQGVWTLRDMRVSSQEAVPRDRVAAYLKEKVHG